MLPVGVAIVDRRLNLVYANRLLHSMAGVPEGTLAGHPIRALVDGNVDALAAAVDDIAAHPGTLSCRLRQHNGSTAPAQTVRWSSIAGSAGKADRLILTFPGPEAPASGPATPDEPADIARLQAELAALRRDKTALRQAKDEADEANAAKTRFLAAASHDLRQPLQALTMIQGLLSHKGDPADDDLLDDMRYNLASISELLDTFLYASRLESGTVVPNLTDIPVADLMRRLAGELAPAVRDTRLRFRCVPCSLVVRSDRVLLEQILRNFLWNALHYTASGSVLLGCRRRRGRVSIQVVDTGIGIPEQDIAAIFQPFHQLDPPSVIPKRGVGLGLAIVDQVARILGHPVHVRSAVGRGSVFSIEVPLALGRGEPYRQSRLVADLPSLLVALIEDDERVLKVTRRLLIALGCQVVAGDSTDALLEALAQDRRIPDLAMIDFRLRRERDGLAAVDRLRAALGCPVPAVIVTGDTSPETMRLIEQSGHAHVHKPVDLARLQTVMRQLLVTATTG